MKEPDEPIESFDDRYAFPVEFPIGVTALSLKNPLLMFYVSYDAMIIWN